MESFGGTFGTVVSAGFLFLIAALNLVVLAGIVKVFRSMRRGEYDAAELERQLENRGFFYRFFGRWMKSINKEWQMYPVGVVFGMGFDTATEVALLTSTALLASEHIPWGAIISLPILFTAGMSLMDTSDGLFMNMAYGWAFFNPVRKVFYNLAITGLSVAICIFIGGIETLSLVPQDFHNFSQISGLKNPRTGPENPRAKRVGAVTLTVRSTAADGFAPAEKTGRAAVRPACVLAAPPGGWTAQSNRLSSLLVVPAG